MSFVTIKAGLRSTPTWKRDQLIFDNISVEGSMVELTGRFTCFGSNIKSYCNSKPEIWQLRAIACDCTDRSNWRMHICMHAYCWTQKPACLYLYMLHTSSGLNIHGGPREEAG